MVRILLFASLRDIVGAGQIEVAVREDMPASRLIELLEEEHPALKRYRSVIRIAVNQEYASPDAVVRPGDEVALFPPVSGGARWSS
ncbi:MAG TPA: molybdopterin converting factor subunit 1 [Acidobacteriota bacterium]|nr:molybdopterin converting factor subunit 1 [Acidobacteriota bacterium]